MEGSSDSLDSVQLQEVQVGGCPPSAPWAEAVESVEVVDSEYPEVEAQAEGQAGPEEETVPATDEEVRKSLLRPDPAEPAEPADTDVASDSDARDLASDDPYSIIEVQDSTKKALCVHVCFLHASSEHLFPSRVTYFF